MDKSEFGKRIKDKVIDKWEYVLAALVPVIIMLLYCLVNGIWIFGDRGLLTGDARNQYLPLFEELWQQVHDGGIHFFSWNAVGGFDFYQNMLYYMFSPSTLLVLLFPKDSIENVLSALLVIRWAMMGLTSVYFFMHTTWNRMTDCRKLVAFTFGMAYTCSTFFVNMLMFFNWMDSFILFPLLLLLIEDMAECGKWKKYCICLWAIMLCNFYIAFTMCLFCIMWFWIQDKKTGVGKKWLTMIGASALAAAMAAIVIIPSVLNVGERYSIGNIASASSHQYLLQNPLSVIQSFFALAPVGRQSTGIWAPGLYCSVAFVCIIGSFIFIQNRRKWKFAICMLVMCCSLIFTVPNMVWHGFAQPHGIGNRFGFCVVMLLLIMALLVVQHIDEISTIRMIISVTVVWGLFVLTFFNVNNTTNVMEYIWTGLLLLVYCILLYLVRIGKITRHVFLMVFLCVALGEIFMNAQYQINTYASDVQLSTADSEDTENLLKRLDVTKMERVQIMSTDRNSGLQYDKASMSGFVSYFNGNMGNLLFSLGLNLIEDAGVRYTGGTPVMNLLFNMKYGIGKQDMEFSDCEEVDAIGDMKLYEMQHTAGLGAVVDESILNWGKASSTDFELQNELVHIIDQKEDDVFQLIPPDNCNSMLLSKNECESDVYDQYQYINKFVMAQNEEVNCCEFTAENEMDLYVMVKANSGMMNYILIDGEMVYQGNDTVAQQMIHVGNVKKNQKVMICSYFAGNPGDQVNVGIQFASFDDDVFEELYHTLTESKFDISLNTNDCIKGKITCKKEGIMLTSIPALKGFCVYVDGKEMQYKKIADALIGVPLREGEHEVVFEYQTPYAYVAIVVSIIGIFLFVILNCMDRIYKRK